MKVTRKYPESWIRDRLDVAISAGTKLVSGQSDLTEFIQSFSAWDQRNKILLENSFEKSGFGNGPKEDYAIAIGLTYPLGLDWAEDVSFEGLIHDAQKKIERLNQIMSVLDLYEGPSEEKLPVSRNKTVDTIFIVHGRADSPRLEVENLVRKFTRIKPVVLADQTGKGAATIIEKLEHFLGSGSSAVFAFVIMTGDDIGKLKGSADPEKPRARQNVVLELGYAMAALGRDRVVLLYEDGLELPTDINGVSYYSLDSAGAWKMRIVQELRAAGIEVDSEAIFS